MRKPMYIFIILGSILLSIGLILAIKQMALSQFTLLVTVIGALMTILVAVGKNLQDRSSSAKSDSILKNTESIKGTLENIANELKGEKYDSEFPGFSIGLMIEIRENPDKRRKFIADFGPFDDQDRVSVYLDIEDNLVFRIFDHERESHIIKVPQSIHTFQRGGKYMVLFEYGYSENEEGHTISFMRIFINNKKIAGTLMEYKLNLPIKLNPQELVIGSDFHNNFPSNIEATAVAVFHAILSKKQREVYLNALETYLKDSQNIQQLESKIPKKGEPYFSDKILTEEELSKTVSEIKKKIQEKNLSCVDFSLGNESNGLLIRAQIQMALEKDGILVKKSWASFSPVPSKGLSMDVEFGCLIITVGTF